MMRSHGYSHCPPPTHTHTLSLSLSLKRARMQTHTYTHTLRHALHTQTPFACQPHQAHTHTLRMPTPWHTHKHTHTRPRAGRQSQATLPTSAYCCRHWGGSSRGTCRHGITGAGIHDVHLRYSGAEVQGHATVMCAHVSVTWTTTLASGLAQASLRSSWFP